MYGVTVGLFSLAGFLAKSFFIDTVIETLNLCKYFTIISQNAEPICNYINAELNHGATIYDARGAYTKDNKQVVMTVVKREQARNLRNYVHKVDPDAFMMITNSSEIIGKGFKDMRYSEKNIDMLTGSLYRSILFLPFRLPSADRAA